MTNRLLALPSNRAPRLLVSPGSPRAAAAALSSFSTNQHGWRGVGARFAFWALRSGMVGALRTTTDYDELTEAVHDVIADHVPGRDVSIAIRLAQDRPNGKPVVRVSDSPSGRALAYIKVVLDPDTRELLANEAKMLEWVSPHMGTEFQVPNIITYARRATCDLLVLTPLHRSRGATTRRVPLTLPLEAVEHLASIAPSDATPLSSSAWWASQRSRVAALPDSLIPRRLQRSVDLLEERWGHCELRFGVVHGDFTAANTAFSAGRGSLWDWERGRTDGPLGIDAVRYATQPLANEEFTTAFEQVRRGLYVWASRAGIDRDTLHLLQTLDHLVMARRFQEPNHPGVTDDRHWRALELLIAS